MVRRPITRLKRRIARARLSPLTRRVIDRRLTYLGPAKLRNLERCLAEVRHNAVPGMLIEAGVALGGSGIVLATCASTDRPFHGYDVFGRIPPPSDADGDHARERYAAIEAGESNGIGGDRYYGYEPKLYEKVSSAFEEFGVAVDGDRISLHRGLFEDTLYPEGPVALAHIDCDWYEPVTTCLDRIWPALSRGGFLLLDDYHDYEGCRRAVDEFIASAGEEVAVVTADSNLVLRRAA